MFFLSRRAVLDISRRGHDSAIDSLARWGRGDSASLPGAAAATGGGGSGVMSAHRFCGALADEEAMGWPAKLLAGERQCQQLSLPPLSLLTGYFLFGGWQRCLLVSAKLWWTIAIVLYGGQRKLS